MGCWARSVPLPQRMSSAGQKCSHPQQMRSGCPGRIGNLRLMKCDTPHPTLSQHGRAAADTDWRTPCNLADHAASPTMGAPMQDRYTYKHGMLIIRQKAARRFGSRRPISNTPSIRIFMGNATSLGIPISLKSRSQRGEVTRRLLRVLQNRPTAVQRVRLLRGSLPIAA